MLGAVGTPDVPPGRDRARAAPRAALRARPLREPPPVRRPDRAGSTTASTCSSSARTPRAPTPARAASSARARPHEIATQGSVNTRIGVERCVRYAFDLAAGADRKHLTLVHKTNVLTFAGDLWQRTFDEVAAEYPDVDTAYHHVDAACIYFVQDPGPLRRHRHRQPLRRHPHRPRWGDRRRHRPGRVGQPQPGPHRAVAVRAGARLGARHRRHRHRRSARGDHLGRDDVGVPGRGRRRGASTRRGRQVRRRRRIDRRDRRRDRAGEESEPCLSRRPRRSGWTASSCRGTRREVHVLTHSLHYGSGVFEGIRTYATADGPGGVPPHRPHPAPLRLRQAHHDGDPRTRATSSSRRASSPCASSGLDSCYVRPIAFLGYGEIGLNPLPCEVNVVDRGVAVGHATSARRASRPGCA